MLQFTGLSPAPLRRDFAGCDERKRSGSEDCLRARSARVPQLLRWSEERLARARAEERWRGGPNELKLTDYKHLALRATCSH